MKWTAWCEYNFLMLEKRNTSFSASPLQKNQEEQLIITRQVFINKECSVSEQKLWEI